MAKTLNSILRAQGRLRKLSPIGIIDIGSNSVRLVVYEGLSRSPTPLFNEKVLCGLGIGLAATGNLDETAVLKTLDTLKRFRVLAIQAGAEEVFILATAAAREAGNGPSFIKKAQAILGRKIHVLTGEQEAEYATYGVVCGFPDANGVSADLGGGSVEFMAVQKTPVGKGITFPLGGLRLRDESGGSIREARRLVRKALKGNSVLKKAQGETFYAVGGTWRALGRLHMARRKYPLNIMHNYEISAHEVQKLCKRLTQNSEAELLGLSSISSNRRGLLPYGAVLLQEIIRLMKPEKIVFSAFGVREGYLYSLLPSKVKKADPLITAAEEMAVLRARSPRHARELVKWTRLAFKAFGLHETRDEKRYRKAACLLADITWRSHPEYRGDQALNIISNGNFVGVDHPGRVYLALASYYRHEGILSDDLSPSILSIVTPDYAHRAKLLGALFRVAYLFSAAQSGVLPKLGFLERDRMIFLLVPKQLQAFKGERLQRRINGLSKVLGREVFWAERD